MPPFDRARTTSYSTLIETMRLSFPVFEIHPVICQNSPFLTHPTCIWRPVGVTPVEVGRKPYSIPFRNMPQDTDSKQPAKTKLLSPPAAAASPSPPLPEFIGAAVDSITGAFTDPGSYTVFNLTSTALCKLCSYYLHMPNTV